MKVKNGNKEKVIYKGVTYNWGDRVVSENGYEFFVVTQDGVWGLIDECSTSFCALTNCDMSYHSKVIKTDSIVEKVIKKYQERSELGQTKYGTTLDRKDLTLLDWINHAQEEAMDLSLYLEKLKQKLTSEGINVD